MNCACIKHEMLCLWLFWWEISFYGSLKLNFWQRNQELEKDLHEAEKTVIARDKLISELRLRMPATAERDEIILRATSKVNAAMSQKPAEKDYQTEHSIRIAQSTISSLQVRYSVSSTCKCLCMKFPITDFRKWTALKIHMNLVTSNTVGYPFIFQRWILVFRIPY